MSEKIKSILFSPNFLETFSYSGIFIIALFMRFWDLGSRAVHHDESLHSYYSWLLSSGNGYIHDPMMHGPFQIEATSALFIIFGDSDYTSRILYAFAGTILVVIPFFLRDRIGRLGAVFVSCLLAFSPALLYFSRFARNDILMAVWTLGLVVCLWRYLDEGKSRYIFIGSALMSIAFSTKETAYLITFLLMSYLIIVLVVQNRANIYGGVIIGKDSPIRALLKLILGGISTLKEGLKFNSLSRYAELLILLITITLPLWAASVSVLQNTFVLRWTNFVLSNPVGVVGHTIGAPSSGGIVLAALVVMLLVWLSIRIGFRWGGYIWVKSAIIFWAIFLLLYSTFFTNLPGIASGVWTSLGYWLVQQGVSRGNQPWYYYFVITSVYEFLPLFFGVIAGIYYARRRDRFGCFLAYWAFMTFILYSIASEKMPWLLVNITLPLIVLTGKFLGDIVLKINWRSDIYRLGFPLFILIPSVLVAVWFFIFIPQNISDLQTFSLQFVLSLIFLVSTTFVLWSCRVLGYQRLVTFALIPIAVIMLFLGIRAGWNASYINGDIPVEMIVYTQTSPEILDLLRYVNQKRHISDTEVPISINIDPTNGFTWPWAWYLRNYDRVKYSSYQGDTSKDFPDASILLVHSTNHDVVDPVVADKYGAGVRMKHRWWFPEEAYRGMTIKKFLRHMIDRESLQRLLSYFLNRELDYELGSEDFHLYIDQNFSSDFMSPDISKVDS